MNSNELDEAWKLFPHYFAEKLSRGKWEVFDYLKYIGKEIAKGIAKGNARIIVEVPPRHGKSELISKYIPTWYLNANPSENVILCSYESDFAAHWGRSVRNLIEDSQDLIQLKLRQDSTAAHRFNTEQGGGMITAGVGGPITGRGGKLIIIDDPVKNAQDAQSVTKREFNKEWFQSTLYTRLAPNGSIVLLQTRWHEDDLAGWLQREQGDEWKVIRLPAIAEINDPVGRKEGEALCPTRYPVEALHKIKEGIGSRWFNSLYQQSPLPDEGVLFRKDWFRFYKIENIQNMEWDMICFSWDLSFDGKETSDYSVGQVWGFLANRAYLLRQFRERTTFIGQMELVKRAAQEFPNYTSVLIEKAANGAALIDSVKNELLGIIEIKAIEEKSVRAGFVTPLWEAGNVYIPDPDEQPWVQAFMDELLKFPQSKNDDQVDAMSQMLRWFSARRDPNIRILGVR